MADQFVAEIRIFPFNFAPYGWAQCNGQLMPISQNTALFSLIGNTYGGDGRSTFGLPNLQGCVPVNQGQGPGLSFYDLGEQGGASAIGLTAAQNASHSHNLVVDQEIANSGSPGGGLLMRGHYTGTPSGSIFGYTAQPPNAALNASSIANSGGNQPHDNLMPYLTLNFCIALMGIFPPRS